MQTFLNKTKRNYTPCCSMLHKGISELMSAIPLHLCALAYSGLLLDFVLKDKIYQCKHTHEFCSLQLIQFHLYTTGFKKNRNICTITSYF